MSDELLVLLLLQVLLFCSLAWAVWLLVNGCNE
jgi:hypothetical protein